MGELINMGDLTTNFGLDTDPHLATSNGEYNECLQHALSRQAFRSWHGSPLYVPDGGGCRRSLNSAHSLIMENPNTPLPNNITIPATATDLYDKNLSTWELMDRVEEWIETLKITDLVISEYADGDPDWLCDIDYPIFTGRGVYPDTNNQCIHLDMGHLSMNPAIRDKRKGILRWCRINGVYHYAREDEGFKELKARLKL